MNSSDARTAMRKGKRSEVLTEAEGIMKGQKRMKSYNKKGNAALVALLLVIIIIGIGASVLLLAGRKSIDETERLVEEKKVTTVTNATNTVTAQTEPEKPKQLDLYFKQAAKFQTTNIKGFTAQASLLADLESNEMLAGMNMDKRIYPASLTKVMTILVACENLKSYDDTYTFKDTDFTKLIDENASMAGFKPGESVNAMDMLYGAILPSGADAVIGLANLTAGSEASFVKLMNQRAKELGLKNTNFVNASGIHNPKHYSSMSDMAVIMKVAYNNVTCRKVMQTFDYTTSKTTQNPEGVHLTCLLGGRLSGFYIDKNGNGANDDKAKVTGGKTGFTDEAGSCIATFCSDSETEHTYICVLAKCASTNQSVSEMMQMYEKYLPGSKAKVPDAVTTAKPGQTTAAKAQATTTTKAA